MPAQKARWLVRNFDRIESMVESVWLAEPPWQREVATGNSPSCSSLMASATSTPATLEMGVYHPDFYDAIAVDKRINKITAALEYTFPGMLTTNRSIKSSRSRQASSLGCSIGSSTTSTIGSLRASRPETAGGRDDD
jgi:hypothetical protein